MKYSKKEWYAYDNSRIPEMYKLWKKEIDGIDEEKIWDERMTAYKNQSEEIERLASKYEGTNMIFLICCSLHDGEILDINIKNPLNGVKAGLKKNYGSLKGIAVKIRVIYETSYFTYLYTLNYELVEDIAFEYPSNKPYMLNPNNLGNWLDDEFSEINNGYYKHEIEFSSGAILSISFRDFSCSERKISIRHPICNDIPKSRRYYIWK